MIVEGGCHCGAIRYRIDGDPITHALCHCGDCRRHAGAPMVGWMMVPADALTLLKGKPKVYQSSANAQRHFCPDCGTGLLYYNAVVLPGIVDVQSATLDNPDAVAARIHVQIAERIGWMATAHDLPKFDRYPSPP